MFDEIFSGFRDKFQSRVTCVFFSIKFVRTNLKFAENFLFFRLGWKKDTRHSFFSGICREIRTKFHKKFAEKNAKFDTKNAKIGNSFIHSRKNVDDVWLKFWDWRTVQRSALCRSRRDLSNEYLLAKIGVDTAENEPLEVWRENSIQYSLHSLIVSPLSADKPLR